MRTLHHAGIRFKSRVAVLPRHRVDGRQPVDVAVRDPGVAVGNGRVGALRRHRAGGQLGAAAKGLVVADLLLGAAERVALADAHDGSAAGIVAGVDHDRVAGRVRAVAVVAVVRRIQVAGDLAVRDRQIAGLHVHARRARDLAVFNDKGAGAVQLDAVVVRARDLRVADRHVGVKAGAVDVEHRIAASAGVRAAVQNHVAVVVRRVADIHAAFIGGALNAAVNGERGAVSHPGDAGQLVAVHGNGEGLAVVGVGRRAVRNKRDHLIVVHRRDRLRERRITFAANLSNGLSNHPWISYLRAFIRVLGRHITFCHVQGRIGRENAARHGNGSIGAADWIDAANFAARHRSITGNHVYAAAGVGVDVSATYVKNRAVLCVHDARLASGRNGAAFNRHCSISVLDAVRSSRDAARARNCNGSRGSLAGSGITIYHANALGFNGAAAKNQSLLVGDARAVDSLNHTFTRYGRDTHIIQCHRFI